MTRTFTKKCSLFRWARDRDCRLRFLVRRGILLQEAGCPTRGNPPPPLPCHYPQAGHAASFSCVLAGGGLRHQGACGQTDDLARKIVAEPVSVPDFFATIHAAMGIDYTKQLHDSDRLVPLTDQGKPIGGLFG
jgi:hypothetical protein